MNHAARKSQHQGEKLVIPGFTEFKPLKCICNEIFERIFVVVKRPQESMMVPVYSFEISCLI